MPCSSICFLSALCKLISAIIHSCAQTSKLLRRISYRNQVSPVNWLTVYAHEKKNRIISVHESVNDDWCVEEHYRCTHWVGLWRGLSHVNVMKCVAFIAKLRRLRHNWRSIVFHEYIMLSSPLTVLNQTSVSTMSALKRHISRPQTLFYILIKSTFQITFVKLSRRRPFDTDTVSIDFCWKMNNLNDETPNFRSFEIIYHRSRPVDRGLTGLSSTESTGGSKSNFILSLSADRIRFATV